MKTFLNLTFKNKCLTPYKIPEENPDNYNIYVNFYIIILYLFIK